jgi:hypothetical protein
MPLNVGKLKSKEQQVHNNIVKLLQKKHQKEDTGGDYTNDDPNLKHRINNELKDDPVPDKPHINALTSNNLVNEIQGPIIMDNNNNNNDQLWGNAQTANQKKQNFSNIESSATHRLNLAKVNPENFSNMLPDYSPAKKMH